MRNRPDEIQISRRPRYTGGGSGTGPPGAEPGMARYGGLSGILHGLLTIVAPGIGYRISRGGFPAWPWRLCWSANYCWKPARPAGFPWMAERLSPCPPAGGLRRRSALDRRRRVSARLSVGRTGSFASEVQDILNLPEVVGVKGDHGVGNADGDQGE